MTNAQKIGCMWALAIALGVGVAAVSTPAIAAADSGKGASSQSAHKPSAKKSGAATKNDTPKPHRRAPKKQPVTKVSALQVRSTATAPEPKTAAAAADPGFISSTHDFFGLFSVTSAADPDDDNYVAFVLRTPLFTDVLTSGTDPENNLGLGRASIGVAGHTVNTFIGPFATFSLAIPVEDPFAPLFTELVRAGF
ncbi:hypothetical protein A5724_27670 [Mycobacterium sp. ACS1612]|uniref:hypothetical protein n=1 Tax=Mycobacterium sp. ACS1612 TaxID=1834117 RepID=UPI0008004CF4|nr:hypothetical protein [Mycobacterium sp. ACS1612]OBF28209.1 hypothetical protein A5724_27670 [Mycobacterium sp. ACS1612]